MTPAGAKTVPEHWDAAWARRPRLTVPSLLRVDTRNRARLLQREVRPGMSFLEIGCAPGKMLAYVAARLGARVAGLDYSPQGIRWSRELFRALNLPADLRHEDIFQTTFAPQSFDVVHSYGLIEHFDDPRAIIRIHVDLTKPGGTVLIAIPDFGGIYGRLAGYFSPDLLAIHNLNIMSCSALKELAPSELITEVDAFHEGNFSIDAVNVSHRWPRFLERPLYFASEAIAAMQLYRIRALCPTLVLKMKRR
jgi:SAM-dependent methyltransferase